MRMTNRVLKQTGLLLLAVTVSMTSAAAQEWRGMGRAGGKVVDDQTGQPIEGVLVKAVMPRSANRGPADSKTNSKGEWAVGGVASGEWALDFTKDGYETKS